MKREAREEFFLTRKNLKDLHLHFWGSFLPVSVQQKQAVAAVSDLSRGPDQDRPGACQQHHPGTWSRKAVLRQYQPLC